MSLFKAGVGAVKHLVRNVPCNNMRGRVACRTATSYRFLEPFNPQATPRVEFEVSQNPEEWKYVERLMPPATVPTPQIKDTYLSGWRPPRPEAATHPYFITRNSNHMIPVYLRVQNRGQQKITLVRRIKGDIWAVEKELRNYIRDKAGKELGMRINELDGVIKIRGDFVHHVTNWCQEKGF